MVVRRSTLPDSETSSSSDGDGGDEGDSDSAADGDVDVHKATPYTKAYTTSFDAWCALAHVYVCICVLGGGISYVAIS